jgi:hypothetical protein
MVDVPTRRTVLLALLVLAVVAQPVAATGDGGVSAAATQTAECSTGDSGSLDADAYTYVDRLDNTSLAVWSGGDIVRIGAHGDCSLAVRSGTATLSAATVDSRDGLVVTTVDLGRGGAFRVSEPRQQNESRAAVAVENVGPENSDQLAVVVRSASGEVSRTEVTATSGRFVDVAMRFRPDGTVDVVLWDPEEPQPSTWDVTAHTTTDQVNWTVSLTARSYLDELGVGTPEPTGSEPTEADGTDETTDDEDDVFDRAEEYREAAAEDGEARGGSGGDGNEGLVMGPFLVVIGALSYYFAYPLSRFSEQLDAIGSKTRWSEVEPAEWKVWLTRVMAVGIAVAGLAWFSTGL